MTLRRGRERRQQALEFGAQFGQFFFQLMVVEQDAAAHAQPFAWSDFWPRFLSSTLENWQSEFLQLVWQTAGLSLLLFWGSSQSKESDERVERKLDLLLRERGLEPQDVDAVVLGELDGRIGQR